eukprot:TRINITY_DN92144_c0_g1_i1.p1 TRINITY_DN92144_c0_g1~~TRINITY_DN92144_c0_g1_i1.p1  ORF type:complete len:615 (-),score=98.26 TRINITY_DN92144_c0_g1_i1:156-2000(-)
MADGSCGGAAPAGLGYFTGTFCAPCAQRTSDDADADDDIRRSGSEDAIPSSGGKPLSARRDQAVTFDTPSLPTGEDTILGLPSMKSISMKSITGLLSMQPAEETEEQKSEELGAIDKEFDYYDPVAKEHSVRDMYTKLVCMRRRRVSVRGGGDGEADVPRMEGSASDLPVSTDEEEAPVSPSASSQKRRAYQREVVTTWGVLVGKALWCRMSGQGEKSQRTKCGLVSIAFKDFSYATEGRQESFVAPVRGTSVHSKRILKMAARRSKTVVSQINNLTRRVGRECNDMFDDEWKMDALSFLFSADYVDTLMILATGARPLLSQERPLIEVELPCKVFGDVHGQLRDLLLLFHAYGVPGADPNLRYVFNGDFVDRGAHQLEVIGVLFALKIVYPDNVWLVRGNHEERAMNRKYGFYEVCLEQLGATFGEKTFDSFQKAFDLLPLACLIDNRILVVHGGIGDGKWNVSDVMAIPKPLPSDDIYQVENQWIFNILWSDPIEDDAICRTTTGLFGVHSSPRSTLAVQFGWNVTKMFCARNGLAFVIRSHQAVEEGSGFDVMHDDMLVRVFSARDYEQHGNDSAIVSLAMIDDKLVLRPQVLQSLSKHQVEHMDMDQAQT